MKFAAIVLAAAALLATPAVAADVPQIVGSWKGPYEGASVEHGFLSGDYTLVVTEQKGRAFRGEITYTEDGKASSEQVAGAIDGDRIVFAGDDGLNVARYADGVIHHCWAAGEQGMAVCADLSRQ
ncbi:hypothetical protein RUR49_04355 [Pseudoxanthobacter sp. M-2]|uniref:hypothetical protein n=1 Tax=Pseudoxanthobacter sp. M-2 TaxID=3078754 RepID=UPI0038FC04F2